MYVMLLFDTHPDSDSRGRRSKKRQGLCALHHDQSSLRSKIQSQAVGFFACSILALAIAF